MKRPKSIDYTAEELDELYERTEQLKDASPSMSDERRVEFVVEDTSRLYTLPEGVMRKLDRLARRRRTTAQKLIERWVREKLAEAS